MQARDALTLRLEHDPDVELLGPPADLVERVGGLHDGHVAGVPTGALEEAASGSIVAEGAHDLEERVADRVERVAQAEVGHPGISPDVRQVELVLDRGAGGGEVRRRDDDLTQAHGSRVFAEPQRQASYGTSTSSRA